MIASAYNYKIGNNQSNNPISILANEILRVRDNNHLQ